MRLVKAMCCAIALTAFLAPGARADEWNKKTILTFSGPVQIPGATLAAGTYVFKLADLNGNRHVVQVFDKDEKHIYGTILAIPDKRLEPSDEPVVLFAERPAGTPQAIRAWFYPGDTFGDEFVYPKSQAVQIAKTSHQSVLATDNANTSDNEAMKSAKVGRIDENGKVTDENAPANTSTSTTTADTTTTTAQSSAPQTPAAQQNKPAGAMASTTTTTSDDAKLKTSSGKNARRRGNAARMESGHAALGTSGQATTANDANQANTGNRARLPKTASNLTLFELLSALSLAGAFGVRLFRGRFAAAR